MDPHHCGLAPLIWGIFKGPSTGSESQWGNCPAQQIQLQQAVSPRRKIFTIIFCQEVKSLLTIQPNFFYPFLDPFVKILGLLVWTRLIFGSIPATFKSFSTKEKIAHKKTKDILTKIGRNQLCEYLQKLRAIAHVFFSAGSELKLYGGLPLVSLR